MPASRLQFHRGECLFRGDADLYTVPETVLRYLPETLAKCLVTADSTHSPDADDMVLLPYRRRAAAP